jgi:dihydroorotase
LIVIAGGLVLTEGGLIETEVWIDGDMVVALGGGQPPSDATVLDATGMLVGPGLVDIHAHLRDPGQTWKEDLTTGSRAAARGGYTAIVAMPNTIPPLDNPSIVADVMRRGRVSGQALVGVAGTLTLGRSGREPADHAGMHAAGVRIFTDDGDTVGDSEVMRSVMDSVAKLDGAIVAQHAESPGGEGQVHAGEVSRRLGLPGIPVEAETSIIERDLRLLSTTDARYHVQHVSAAATVGLIGAAKASGARVTAEVTPHHLALDDSTLTGPDTNLKMYPPLRSPEDREALIAGLRDGTIDVVATDHAPHSPAEKRVGFVDAPRGVTGLETAAAVVWRVLQDPVRMFEVMSTRPASIGGVARHGHPVEVGAPANLMVFDPSSEWVVGEFASKSANSPFLGQKMDGRVVATIFEGTLTHNLEGAR